MAAHSGTLAILCGLLDWFREIGKEIRESCKGYAYCVSFVLFVGYFWILLFYWDLISAKIKFR